MHFVPLVPTTGAEQRIVAAAAARAVAAAPVAVVTAAAGTGAFVTAVESCVGGEAS